MVFLSISMVLIYGSMACLLLFSSLFAGQFPFGVRMFLGIVFLVYSFFRTYRIVKEYEEK